MILLTLRDKDIGEKSVPISKYHTRKAARVIILNKGKMALMHVRKNKYHKLPGGGLNPKESLIDGLTREVKEETGCKIKVIQSIGEIIEYRSRYKLRQTSYCYIAEMISIGEQKFTRKEKKEEFRLEWIKLDNALSMMRGEKPAEYEGKFIVKRDVCFLENAKKMMTGK